MFLLVVLTTAIACVGTSSAFSMMTCDDRNGGCSHECHYINWKVQCSCPPGYRLQPNDKTCEDINECLETNFCNFDCVNTEGGFYCTCANGYILTEDKKQCREKGIEYCLNQGCSEICFLAAFGFSCHCDRLSNSTCIERGLDLDPCNKLFCISDGICVNKNSAEHCRCPNDHEIPHCENVAYQNFAWIIIVALSVILVALLITLCYFRHKKRNIPSPLAVRYKPTTRRRSSSLTFQ